MEGRPKVCCVVVVGVIRMMMMMVGERVLVEDTNDGRASKVVIGVFGDVPSKRRRSGRGENY